VVVPLARTLGDDRRQQPTPTDDAVADLRAATAGTLDLTRDPRTGGIDTLATEPGAPLDLEAQDPAAASAEFADRYGDALGAPGTELVTLSTTDRLAGGTAVRLQQQVGDVPVYGGQASLQLDGAGDVVSALSDLSARAATVDTTADLAPATAREQALVTVARDSGVPADRLQGSEPERWIYDPQVLGAPEQGGARLAWRVEVTGPDVATTVLVDADQGGAFLVMDQDVHALQRFVCDQPAPEDRNCDGDYAATELQPSTPDQGEAHKAFLAMGLAYLFFQDQFGRDSLDGAGLPLRATVNWCSATTCSYDNAFWHGTHGEEGIVLGTGFVTDDIVGHELTHGLVQYTAGLFPQYQSGAINESMADVFGELIDLTNPHDGAGGDARWLMGEDRAAGYLRNLLDPTAKNHPDRMTSPRYRGDANGMHANAGVGNRAAALMTDGGTVGSTTITGLGVDKVAAIYYETLTAHLTSASDYADLAHALPQACVGLVGTLGITVGDCAQVEAAVGAVEMATDPPQAPAPEAPVCPDGIAPMDLFADDFEDPESGNWTTSAEGGWNWRYPPPDTQRYATSGDLNLWGPDTGWPEGNPNTGGKHFGDARIRMTDPVALPPGTQPYLWFRHAWFFDTTGGANYDGGVVEYATDGDDWNDAGPLFTHNGYNGTLNASTSTNPLNGRSAFVDVSRGYVSTRLDLSTLADEDVRFRFRLGEDRTRGDLGWYVDDVRLYLCPEPAVTVTQSADQAAVTVGEDIDLHLTIANTGNVPLTGVTVIDPDVPDCEGPVPTIAVGATHTVDCTYETVDPDDLGTFTNVATVGANELSGTTASNPISIPVLAPGTPLVMLQQAVEQPTVAAGEPVDLHLTITNIGNVPLTGLAIVDPDAPACAGPVTLPGGATELVVGGRHTVDCSHTPSQLGPWTNHASVTANELPEPTPAEDLEVQVVDVTDPVVTVTSPADGAVVNQGQAVMADYACSDDQGEVSCTGDVPDGQAIDTSTPGPRVFTVTAEDQAGNQTVVDHTYVVASRRPDGRIRKGAGATVGNDVINTTGAGQNRSARVLRGRSATFFVTVQNDGSHPERIRVWGQRSTRHFTVAYWTGGQNVTAGVQAGSYRTPVLGPGGIRTIKVVVTVRNTAPVGSRIDRLVSSTSTNDPTRKDVVRFIVRRR